MGCPKKLGFLLLGSLILAFSLCKSHFFFLSYVYVWNCTSLRPIYLLYCISLVSRPIWNLKLLKYKKHASEIEEIGAIFHETHRAGHVVMPLGLCEHCFSAYSFFFALSTWQTPIHLSRDNSPSLPLRSFP